MNNASPPRPLRVLLAWPEPAATTLWRALQPLHPDADVTLTPIAMVQGFLHDAGYFHVLHVALADWRALTPQQRRRLAARVCLIVIGPDSAVPGDLDGAANCLYLPAVTTAEEGIALLATLHGLLAEGWNISEIIAKSGGRLALAGGEPAWPAATGERPLRNAALDRPAPGRAVNVVDASGGAVAIGPGAKATNVAEGGTYIEQQTVRADAGVAIGQIVVLGDAVSGDKIVHQAAGDQININRGAPLAGKVEQKAGGDQVNINRTGGAPSAGAPRTCSKCGELVEPEHRFCLHCGTALTSAQRDKTTKGSFRIRLRQGLIDCFSEEELHTLCFDMGLDYETLPARGKADKAREIVAHFERINGIACLVERCRRLRPNGPWDEKPEQ